MDRALGRMLVAGRQQYLRRVSGLQDIVNKHVKARPESWLLVGKREVLRALL